MDKKRLADGFRGQIMHVLPRPLLADASRHVLAGELYPTDIGWFPRARGHFRERPDGADQHILIYCTSGGGWFEIEGRRGELGPRQTLLIPKGRSHAYGASEKDPWSIHWVHFTGEDAAYLGGMLGPGEFILPVAMGVENRLAALFRECCESFSGGVTHNRILFAAQTLRHLLAVLFFDNPAFTPGVSQGSHRNFDASIEHMKRRLSAKLTLGELACHSGLSIARYSLLFRAQTGHSPIEHFIRLRIQAACRLLDTTDLTCKESHPPLAMMIPIIFSRRFRKVIGQSPREYRRTAKG